MKKISLLVVVSLLTMLTSAQELTSKKGTPILPTAWEWALSVDATPFLDFAGNLIGANGTNVAPTMNFLSGNRTIIGKYFVTDTKAYRLGARLGINSTTTKNELTDLPNYTEDKATASSFDLGLTAGVEFRRGISRLQGYYGGEVGLAVGSGATSFTYGDPAAPTSTLQKSKNGFMFGLGARAFAGVEYFVFPKISVGGEFGWGVAFTSVGKAIDVREAGGVVTETVQNEGGSTFGMDSNNLNTIFGPAGSLRMTFHF